MKVQMNGECVRYVSDKREEDLIFYNKRTAYVPGEVDDCAM